MAGLISLGITIIIQLILIFIMLALINLSLIKLIEIIQNKK